MGSSSRNESTVPKYLQKTSTFKDDKEQYKRAIKEGLEIRNESKVSGQVKVKQVSEDQDYN